MHAKERLTDREIEAIYRRQWQRVWRLCFSFMRNPADTEDLTQDTFVKLIEASPRFCDERHETAWLMRTAGNLCRNALKKPGRLHEDETALVSMPSGDRAETNDTLDAVMSLPDRLKTVVYLYYYEGYAGDEIARMLGAPASTVRNRLRDARAILKEKLGGEPDET